MSLLTGGDDVLIKKLHGTIYVLVVILIWFLFGFGVIRLFPKHPNHIVTCTYTYQPWVLHNSSIQVNVPNWIHSCRG